MSEVIECPHCYTAVLPKTDRICPACNGNVDRVPSGSEDRTSVHIHHGADLPPVCWHCGMTATRCNTLAASRRDREGSPSSLASCFMTLLSLPVGLFLLLRGIEQRSTVRIKMPVCADCERYPPEATYVDFENARATIVVHRNLEQAIDERRERGHRF